MPRWRRSPLGVRRGAHGTGSDPAGGYRPGSGPSRERLRVVLAVWVLIFVAGGAVLVRAGVTVAVAGDAIATRTGASQLLVGAPC